MNIVTSSLFVAIVSVVACTNTAAAPDAPESNAQALRATEPTPDLTGTWVFDLPSSEIATAIHAECNAKPDPNACWSEIATEAKREKLRFTQGSDGHTRWESFGITEDAKEEPYLAMPLDLTSDGPGHVLAKVAGPATGPHAERLATANINQLRFELVDAHTLVVNDPKKGRLFYTKE